MLTTDLSNQTALVTGASRGIGRAIAETLARCGAKVACVARSAEKLKETVDAIAVAGGTAEAFECDVSDTGSVNGTVDAVLARWEKLHILVNNAGITRDTLLARMSDEQWDEVLDTNLRGAFLFTRAVTRPAVHEEVKKRIPVRRLGQPDDIAAAVLYLSSAAAGYVTGQVLTVDGGMSSSL
jgi:3-oxoacyl-[acyl-carrier protein] reductase